LLQAFLARSGVSMALAKLLDFLARKAGRAHPKRDRATGRLYQGSGLFSNRLKLHEKAA